MKINLTEVLSKAGKIIWKFKALWIFGILAGCGSSSTGNFNFNNSGWSGNSRDMPDFLQPLQNLQPEQMMQRFLNQFGGFIVVGILLLCVLWIVFYFLGVVGKTGLIKGASKADSGVQTLSFGELWTDSTPYFWRMFGLNLLIGLPFLLLIMVMVAVIGFAGYTAFANGSSGGGLGALVVALGGILIAVLCVISILSIIVGMILEQAQNALVLEDLGVFEALGRGWNIFKSAILTILVVAIVLGILGWIAGFLFAIPLIAVAIPAFIGMAASQEHNIILPLVIAGGCFLLYLPFLLVLRGILVSYTQSVWTLVYRRLAAVPAPASVSTIQTE